MAAINLIACGCQKIVSAGSCGVLADLPENEFLVPVKALRDEGTSYHYLPAACARWFSGSASPF